MYREIPHHPFPTAQFLVIFTAFLFTVLATAIFACGALNAFARGGCYKRDVSYPLPQFNNNALYRAGCQEEN